MCSHDLANFGTWCIYDAIARLYSLTFRASLVLARITKL